MADNIRNVFDGIAFQTPKPHLTPWWLQCDELLVEFGPCSMTRGNRVKVVVVVTIQTIAVQVFLADSSAGGNDVGGADVDDMGVAHDTVVEMMECDLTLDK